PPVVLLVNDVAVGAGPRIRRQVGQALGVDEGEGADSRRDADDEAHEHEQARRSHHRATIGDGTASRNLNLTAAAPRTLAGGFWTNLRFPSGRPLGAPGRMLATADDAMAHGDPRRGAADPGGAESRPALPFAKAFVVQFGAETDTRLGKVTGRIEHLQTGRRSRFASVDDLLACIMTMLAGTEASRD